MKDINRILKEHKKLLTQYFQTDQPENDLDAIKEYILLLRSSGSYIYRSYEREQINAMLRFWSNYIYTQEKKISQQGFYQFDDIFPYSGAPVRPKAAFLWLLIMFALISLFAFVSFLVFQHNLKQLNLTDIPNGQNGSYIPSLIAASTKTSIRQNTPQDTEVIHATPSPDISSDSGRHDTFNGVHTGTPP